MTLTVGTPIEELLVNFFAFVGSAGTIYFAFGAIFTGLGVDGLWITRRSRGRTTELKGIAWMAISFTIAVFMRILVGPVVLLLFAIVCWLGWIGFQAYLSTRTSLRVATIAEPKKGGFLLGIGSFIILIIGLGIIAAEAVAALYLIPYDVFGIGTMVNGIFAQASLNIINQMNMLYIAYAMMGLFAVVMLFSFLRYSGRGAALNIAILTLFIGIYAGYFLVNIMRRNDIFGLGPVDIIMSLFFLVYAMSGIGSTVTEAIEESRARTGDFGPLFTFFLASGFFFVDSIIAVASDSTTLIWEWFHAGGIFSDPRFLFLFRDVSKLIAFPLVAIFTAIYYLRVERAGRIVGRARDKGEKLQPDEVDSDVAEELEEEEKSRPAQRYSAPEPERDDGRLRIDSSRRLGAPKRLGDDDDD
ncbi:hypothetical protein EU528_12570 [Candidatus Thorarchaeota archaeon]|nr:MAG: hypothetical protein EU528_12570 [Candidatus Thorarchaeota archaeon]